MGHGSFLKHQALLPNILLLFSISEKWFPKSQQNSSGILKAVIKGAMGAWERPLFPKTKNFYAKERDIHPCPPFVVTIFAFRMVLIGNAILIECSQTHSNFHTSPWIILGMIPIELHGYSYFGKEFPFLKCILVMVSFFISEISCNCTIQRGIQSLVQKHEKAFCVASYQVLLLIIYGKVSILNLSD